MEDILFHINQALSVCNNNSVKSLLLKARDEVKLLLKKQVRRKTAAEQFAQDALMRNQKWMDMIKKNLLAFPGEQNDETRNGDQTGE